MVEFNSRIRRLVADSKFAEAQQEAEVIISQKNISERSEILEVYFHALKAQAKPLPIPLVLEFCELSIASNVDETIRWLTEILERDPGKYKHRILLLQIRIADFKGKTAELYHLISDFQVELYKKNNPFIDVFVQQLIEKYFKDDFQLKLQRLGLHLKRLDLVQAENFIKELILSCYERTSIRGEKEKLSLLVEVLNASEKIYYLEIYKSLCLLLLEGIKGKKDFKRLVEAIIYFDSFKMQTLILFLLKKLNLNEELMNYAKDVKANSEYNFVYFDKYFRELKPLFFNKSAAATEIEKKEIGKVDLKVGTNPVSLLPLEMISHPEAIDEESHFLAMLKHQTFTTAELIDISISFFQAQMISAAFKASELAIKQAETDHDFLKASYLKFTCLMAKGDYRAALDTSLQALDKASSQNDILSFLYGQAEAYIRLDDIRSARYVLKKIISIDAHYRMARERLERLNEI